MIPLAIVLLLIVVIFAALLFISNPAVLSMSLFSASVPVTFGGVFLTGAISMAVVVLALILLRNGVKRAHGQRKQIASLRAAASGASGDKPSGSKKGGLLKLGKNDKSSSNDAATATPAAAPEAAAATSSTAASADSSASTSAERQALLEETDELTGGSNQSNPRPDDLR